MDDALEKALSRIVEANEKARAQSADRARRLMDALVQDSQAFTEAVNDIIADATGSRKEGDGVLGEDGEAQPPDGDANGPEPQAGT